MHTRTILLLLAAGFPPADGSDVAFRRVAFIQHGPRVPVFPLVCTDSDHDSLGEIAYGSAIRWLPCWEILEYRPVNNFVVVKSDTGTYPYPPYPILGNFVPSAAGDLDGDGKAELIGEIPYVDTVLHLYRKVLCVVESPDAGSHPDTVVWSIRDTTPGSGTRFEPRHVTDLDQDLRPEILTCWDYATGVFENVADNRESLVFCQRPLGGGRYALGDFDQNGRLDFAYGGYLCQQVSECTGDNQYQVVCSLYTGLANGADIFSGNDVDHNGLPEFFVVYDIFRMPGIMLYLYQFEARFPHAYEFFLVDSFWASGASLDKQSLCADVDGDGFEELIWSCAQEVRIMKGWLPHRFEVVHRWFNDHGRNLTSICNAADYNRNGYNEIYIAGDNRISVLEVEALQVTYPDRVLELRAGDTCRIRWRIITPPRCDSVSLFLKTDTVVPEGERFWRLDTIVTGLAPTESSYSWVVPDTVLNWAKVLAIAYGPGWQFDESDTFFSIRRTGLAEVRPAPSLNWSLSVRPNPASRNAVVSYVVPQAAVIRLGLYDAGGRLVRELAAGEHAPGRYELGVTLPAGVCFCRLESPGTTLSRKVVLSR